MPFALNYSTVWEKISDWYRGSWVDRFFTFLGERVFAVTFEEYEKIPLPPNAGVTVRNWILSFLVAFWITALTMAIVKAIPGGMIRRLLSLGATDRDHAVTLAEAGYRKSAFIRRDLARGGALAKLLCRPDDGERTVAGTPIPSPEAEVDLATGKARPSLLERLEGEKAAAVSQPENGSAETVTPSEKDEPLQSERPEEGNDPAQAEPKGAESSAPEPLAPLNFETDRFYIPESLRVRAELRFARRGSGVLSVVLSVVGSTLVAFLLCGIIPLLFRLANWMLGG